MKRKIVLPSLFVLNAFLVGMTPKTSKAGSVEKIYDKKIDSVSYRLDMDSDFMKKYDAKYFETIFDVIKKSQNQKQKKDSIEQIPSYNISWNGGSWVKYTAPDGSGFIRTGGSRTWRNMNPGALRNGDFSRQYGACGSAGGFAVFPTEEHGMRALCGLLRSEKYAKLSIAAAIYKYAPPYDNNNTGAYQRKLSAMTGLSLSKKLHQLTQEELKRVAEAIRILEGWKPGTNETFTAVHEKQKTNSLQPMFMKQNQYS